MEEYIWKPTGQTIFVNKERAARMKKMGFVTEPTGDLAKLKVDELKAYAAELGVDLEGITKKADIVAAIEAAGSSK